MEPEKITAILQILTGMSIQRQANQNRVNVILDYSMWAFCAYTIFIEPRDDTFQVEMGRLSLVLSLASVTLNVPKHNLMLPTGQ